MRILPRSFAAAGVCLLAASSVAAQTRPLEIVVVGGFLGYEDGFVREHESTKALESNGGLDTIAGWVTGAHARIAPAFNRQRQVLLAAGNNLDFTGSPGRLAELDADAVGFSIDDFLRSLREPEQAARVVQALQAGGGPRFVVSNAALQFRRRRLNRVSDNGLTLGVARDTSVGWVSSLTISCGDCPDLETATLTAGPLKTTLTADRVTRSSDGRTLTLTLPRALQPGTEYTLSAGSSTFRFHTHEALTRPSPAAGVTVPDALREAPVQYVQRSGGPALLVVAMVDPGVKSLLGADRWKWKDRARCKEGECEIVFLPAAEAMRAVDSLAATLPGEKPVVVLLSGLTDTQTSTLIDAAPAIRFVVLDPDSSSVGGRSDDAVINRNDPATTQLWVRAHWITEQIAVMRADLAWENAGWRVTNPGTGVLDAPALPLTWTVTPGRVSYSLGGKPLFGGRSFAAYPTLAQITSDDIPEGMLWVTHPGTAGLLLDVMRDRLDADLALLPAPFVDVDVVGWLAAQARKGPLDWLSPFILDKVLYKTEHMVSVTVDGDKLADTLEAIRQAQDQTGVTLYSIGLGSGARLSAVDTRTLRVNGRDVVPTHAYKIAMPQSLAEAQMLRPSRTILPSLLAETDLRVRATPAATLYQAPLPDAQHRQYERRGRLYASFAPMHLDFHESSVEDRNGILGNVPLTSSPSKPERQVTANASVDVGLEWLRWAARMTADAEYSNKTIDLGRPTAVSTNPSDEFTFGPRLDYRIWRGGLPRLFVGYFRQTWFVHHLESPLVPENQATRLFDGDGNVVMATTKGAGVRARVEKPRYLYWRAGVDTQSLSPHPSLTFSNLVAAFDFYGTQYKDRTAVLLKGFEPQSIAEYYQSPKNLVNRLFAENAALFGEPQTLEFGYDETGRQQRRWQLEGTATLKVGAASLTSTAQYRRYLSRSGRPDFTADWTVDVKTKLTWPIRSKINVGPFFDLYRVGVKGTSDRLRYRKVGIAIDFPLFIGLRPARLFH